MKIRIEVENDHGTFSESFSDQHAAMQYFNAAPHLTAGLGAVATPGIDTSGPSSIPAKAPGPEIVAITVTRPEGTRVDKHVVRAGGDTARDRLFDAAARLAGATMSGHRTPVYRTVPGPNHQVTVTVEDRVSGRGTGTATFTVPALLRAS